MAQKRSPHVAILLRLDPVEVAALDDTARELCLSRTALIRLMVRHARFLTVSMPPITRDSPHGE
jgi:hypothetical protein